MWRGGPVRRGALAAAAIVVLAVAAGLGGYLYFFSGLRESPGTLTLSPSPQDSTTPLANLSGRWQVAAGSSPRVGYRVREQFVNESSASEAVARTGDLSGGLTVRDSGADLRAGDVLFTVQLSRLRSVDTVAGRDVSQRDALVQRALDVARYPVATFQAGSLTLPRALRRQGAVVDFDVPGTLSIHGVSRHARLHLQGKLAGGRFQVAGSTQIAMDDFGVMPPAAPFVAVDPAVTLELLATLRKT